MKKIILLFLIISGVAMAQEYIERTYTMEEWDAKQYLIQHRDDFRSTNEVLFWNLVANGMRDILVTAQSPELERNIFLTEVVKNKLLFIGGGILGLYLIRYLHFELNDNHAFPFIDLLGFNYIEATALNTWGLEAKITLVFTF